MAKSPIPGIDNPADISELRSMSNFVDATAVASQQLLNQNNQGPLPNPSPFLLNAVSSTGTSTSPYIPLPPSVNTPSLGMGGAGTSTSGMFQASSTPLIPNSVGGNSNGFSFAEDARNLSTTTKDNTKATKELTQAIKENTEISKQTISPAGGTTSGTGAGQINDLFAADNNTPQSLNPNFNQFGQSTAQQQSQQAINNFRQNANLLNNAAAQNVQQRASGAYGTTTSQSGGGMPVGGGQAVSTGTSSAGGFNMPRGGGGAGGGGTGMPQGGRSGGGGGGTSTSNVNPSQQVPPSGAPNPVLGLSQRIAMGYQLGLPAPLPMNIPISSSSPPPSSSSSSSQPMQGPITQEQHIQQQKMAQERRDNIGRGLMSGSGDFTGGIAQMTLASGYAQTGAFGATGSNAVQYTGYQNMIKARESGTVSGVGATITGIGAMIFPSNALAGGIVAGVGMGISAYGGYDAAKYTSLAQEQQTIANYKFNRMFGYGPGIANATTLYEAASNIPYYGGYYQRSLGAMINRGNFAALEQMFPVLERNLEGGTGQDTLSNRAELARDLIDQQTNLGISVEQSYSNIFQTANAMTRRRSGTRLQDELLKGETYAGLISAGFSGSQIATLVNLNQRDAFGFGNVGDVITNAAGANVATTGLGSRIARIGQAKGMTALGTMGFAESVIGVGLSLSSAGLTGNANQMFESAQGLENTGFTGYQGLRAYEAYTRFKHGFAGAGQEGLAGVYGGVGRSLLYAESLSETGDPLKAAQRIQRAAPQTNFQRLRKLIGDDNIALQIAAAAGFASADEVQYAGMAGMVAPGEEALPSAAKTGEISASRAFVNRRRQKNLYEEVDGVKKLETSIGNIALKDYVMESEVIRRSGFDDPAAVSNLIKAVNDMSKSIIDGFGKVNDMIQKFEKEVGATKAGMTDISGILQNIHNTMK